MMSLTEARFGDVRVTDPNVEECLAEPMVRLLMRRDHIRLADARRLYADAACRIHACRATAPPLRGAPSSRPDVAVTA